ncbi:MAG: hypothetical protein NTW90_02255 [Nitrosospira sp.]|nr:hypothetical protein [Nitrosospira sp.]
MKTKKLFTILSVLSLLVPCAQLGAVELQDADTRSETQNIGMTRSYHDNLAKDYEVKAKEILAKVEEKKRLLEEYDNHSQYLGRQGQDLHAHTWAMVNRHERAAEEALNKVSFHRKMASELAKRDYATPAETPSQRNNRENKAKVGPDSTDKIGSPGQAL